MSLIDLKNYLRQQQQITLTDLANHFNTEPDVIRAMLTHWQSKGKVIPIHNNQGCDKRCIGCCQQKIEIYRWQEEPNSTIPVEFPVIFKENH